MVSCLMSDSTALASAIVRCCHRLLEVFGVKLMPGNTTHLWYQEALNVKYNEPVEDAQAYLAGFDVELK